MRALLTIAMILPGFAFAAGGGDGFDSTTKPPKTTKTTKECRGNRVWDPAVGRCVRPQSSSLDQDGLMRAVRELAYAGRSADAQAVLMAMADQNDDLVQTYWGFTLRKLGNRDLALAHYRAAIDSNPDNILARSYMGQGFVEEGDVDAAIRQWRAIIAAGGEGSWAETSLREAIRTGATYSY